MHTFFLLDIRNVCTHNNSHLRVLNHIDLVKGENVGFEKLYNKLILGHV